MLSLSALFSLFIGIFIILGGSDSEYGSGALHKSIKWLLVAEIWSLYSAFFLIVLFLTGGTSGYCYYMDYVYSQAINYASLYLASLLKSHKKTPPLFQNFKHLCRNQWKQLSLY